MKYFFSILEENGKHWIIKASSERQAKKKRKEILETHQIIFKKDDGTEKVFEISKIINISHIKPLSKMKASWNLAWSNKAYA